MAQTKIKAGLFEGIIGNGADGYFLMSNGDGTMTWASTIANPTITSIAYPGSATAADPAGGETITVTGTGFKTGATVTVGGTAAPAVSYVSATQITFTTPAKVAGDYDIVITNTDTGSATYINGISYNGIPSWTTPTGSLGTFASGETISTITLQATEPDAGTITFNITSGALPTGLSLTGADIDGTTSLETADTLYTFTVTATDDESQESTPRTFTITVTKQFIGTENFTINTYIGNAGVNTVTQSIEGKIGTAAFFNGTTSQIRTVGNPIPSTSSVFTVSFWFQLDNTNTNNHIFSIFDNVAGTNKLLIRSLTGGDFQVGVYGTSGSNFITTNSSTFPYTTGVWYHLVYISRSDGNNEFWIDGTQITTSSGVAANTTSSSVPITMGGRGDLGGSSTERFGGKLDQVRIFNKAISSSEVATLYGESNTSTTKSTTDIFDDGSGVALYEFEEGAKDSSITQFFSVATYQLDGNANDLTTNYNGTWIGSAAYTTGKFGQSGNFDGSNYIQLPSGIDSILNTKNFGFSLWVKAPNAATDVVFSTETTNSTFQIHANWGFAGSYGLVNGGGNDINLGAVDSDWHHIVVTSDGSSSYKGYFDGVYKGSIPYRQTSNVGTLLGAHPSGGFKLVGEIDQVRIYNTELSADNVNTLYNESLADSSTNLGLGLVGLYSGTPTDVSFVGTSFQPDFVWVKNRDNANNHVLFDSIRGATNWLNSNNTNAQYNNATTADASLTSNGFTTGTSDQTNRQGDDFVAWCFKAGGTAVSNTDGTITTNVSANPAAGFSIIEYQGSNGGGSTGTGLSSPVELMIVKRYTTTQEFYLFQGSGTGTWNSFQIAPSAVSTSRSVTVTNSTIQIPAAGDFNSDPNSRYISYCLHSVDGYQKIGTYTGNGTTSNTITTGFQPRFLMVKSESNQGFRVVDTSRSPSNPVTKDLRFESAATENDWASYGWGNIMNINSDGFEIISTDSQYNANTQTYIYWAIA